MSLVYRIQQFFIFCNNPLTGAGRQVLLSSNTISSCSFRIFFTACTYELSSNRSLSGGAVDRYSSLQRFFILIVKSILYGKEQTKKPFILYSGRRALHSSRVTTCICCHLTIATSASIYILYILSPDYGGIRCSSTLASLMQSDFFSQLQGLFRAWLTCRILSSYLLSVRNG